MGAFKIFMAPGKEYVNHKVINLAKARWKKNMTSSEMHLGFI
jgi:hypothetical protein